jgi:hypothetical protein
MSLRSLYQATHAEVRFSRLMRVRIGPVRNGSPRACTRSCTAPIVVLQSPVVQGVADGPDRRGQPFEHHCLAVMYCGVLTSGVRRMDRVVQWADPRGTAHARVYINGVTTSCGGRWI